MCGLLRVAAPDGNRITSLIAAGNSSRIAFYLLEINMTKQPTLTLFEPLLTPSETAKSLGVSLSWLAKARLRGDGPRYIKIGRVVRYPVSSVRDYLKARTPPST